VQSEYSISPKDLNGIKSLRTSSNHELPEHADETSNSITTAQQQLLNEVLPTLQALMGCDP
jgi:hypothetical protein